MTLVWNGIFGRWGAQNEFKRESACIFRNLTRIFLYH